MSLNADDSYTGSVTLEQMRHEKKKQRILDKQKSKVNGEFGESMMRLQKKIDDLQSHRRQLNDENEEGNDAYQDDFIDEKNIDRMMELNNNSNGSKKSNKDSQYNLNSIMNSDEKIDEQEIDFTQGNLIDKDLNINKDKLVNRMKFDDVQAKLHDCS